MVPYPFLQEFAKKKRKKIRHVDTIVPISDGFFHARGSRGAFYPTLLYVKLISQDMILKLKVLVTSKLKVVQNSNTICNIKVAESYGYYCYQ